MRLLLIFLTERQRRGIMIKSNKIYSPQRFLEAVTGKIYILNYNKPIVPQIEQVLINHKKPYSSYPLEDAQKALNKQGNIVLVSCTDMNEKLEFEEKYRWFKVSKDFRAA